MLENYSSSVKLTDNNPPVEQFGHQPCDNWQRLSRYDGKVFSIPTCGRAFCKCLLRRDSTVTHGLAERRRLFEIWKRRLPAKSGFLTWIVHSRSTLTQKFQTRLVVVIRLAISAIDPDAIVWVFIHWKAFGNAGYASLVPHLHIGIFSDCARAILASNTDLSLSSRVETQGSLVRVLRKRGRPSARECKGDDTRIITRIEATEVRYGGERDTWGAWLHYVARCRDTQDATAVRPPYQHRWFYIPGKPRAHQVIR
jgi:hypothetical protein